MRTKDFECYVVQGDVCLRDAMILIEENRHRSLVVMDGKACVVGMLSDGDIRKAMLQDRLMETKVSDIMNTHFLFVREDDDPKISIDYFNKEHIFIIPVVNKDGQIVALDLAY